MLQLHMLVQTALRSISLLTDLARVLTLNLVGSAAIASRFFSQFARFNLLLSVTLTPSCDVDSAKSTLELRLAQLVILKL